MYAALYIWEIDNKDNNIHAEMHIKKRAIIYLLLPSVTWECVHFDVCIHVF